jgi:hypothetical protein
MKEDLVVWVRYVQEECPPGIRPVVPKQQVREYVYAYVAVAPQLGQMTSLILPYANTKMMNLFLKQVSQEFAEYFIIMQVDKAAWHLSKSLQIPENIRLLPQPSHSPELMLFCTYLGRYQGELFLQSHLEINGLLWWIRFVRVLSNSHLLQKGYVL